MHSCILSFTTGTWFVTKPYFPVLENMICTFKSYSINKLYFLYFLYNQEKNITGKKWETDETFHKPTRNSMAIQNNFKKVICFPQLYKCTAPGNISWSPLTLATDVTDVTFGARDLWPGTRTGVGGTATLVQRFWPQPPCKHSQGQIIFVL